MEESDLIDKFLFELLTKEELAEFKTLLLTNPDLREKIKIRKAVIAGIQEANLEKIKLKLKEHDALLERKTAFILKKHLNPLLYSGITVILLIAAVFSYHSYTNRYLKYSVPVMGIPNKMSSINSDPDFIHGMNSYKEGDYKTANKMFSSLLSRKSENDTLLFFTGISSYQLQKYRDAIVVLGRLEKNSTSRYFPECQYFLGLSFLSSRQKEKAKSIFQQIADNPVHKYQENSIRILKDVF